MKVVWRWKRFRHKPVSSRVGNGRNDSSKVGQRRSDQYPDDEEEGDLIKMANNNSVGGVGGDSGGINRLRGWHHSSRIIKVSRTSGDKDRHSKVWTSKGLRDRRVRLSVTTAIQFYDLQDRLGYDQPSKAVEWLINSAADAISELPSLNRSFPDTPKQLSDEKRASGGTEQGFDSAEVELDGDPNYQQNQNQHLSLSKSACSSTSDTSKNSGLSLSRPYICENRVKARERARERTAKKIEKKSESRIDQQNVNPISQNPSFTELLATGISSVSINNNNNNHSNSHTGSAHQNPNCEPNLLRKAATARQWSAGPMDYFTTGLLGSSSSLRSHHSSVSGQIQLGNSLTQTLSIPQFNVSSLNHQELQHFSFVPDHLYQTTSHSSAVSRIETSHFSNYTCPDYSSARNAVAWDCMTCLKASSSDCGFCSSGSGKLLSRACLISNDTVQDSCLGEKGRMWYTRGCPSKYGWLVLIGLALYIIFFSPEMGTVPWIVNSEIYPLRFRGVGGGIAATGNWISNLNVAQSFLSLTQEIVTAWTFLIFGLISVIALIFVLIYVPEMKGLPIEEVEKMQEHRALHFRFWEKKSQSQEKSEEAV